MRALMRLLFSVLCVLISSGCLAGENQFKTVISEQRLKESNIEKELSKAVMLWLIDGNEPAALECDRLVDSLLAVGEPTARSYFIAAQVANLRQKPQEAIILLEKAINKHPDERAPIGIHVPVKIVGHLWIANIARQSGDIIRTQNAYESVLSILGEKEAIKDIEDKSGLIMMCNLYLAELESENLQNEQKALSHLQAIADIKKPTGPESSGYDLYKSWANYERTKMSIGKDNANLQLTSVPEEMSMHILAVQYLRLSGITGEPLTGSYKGMNVVLDTLINRVIQSKVSQIDRDLARLGYGYDQQYKGNFYKAEKCYSSLFQDDSFFSPMAGISLARVKKSQEKTAEANEMLEQVRKKYPGYNSLVTKIRQSWKKYQY